MGKLLNSIVHDSAARFPERQAFRCNAESLSYADLEVRSNQLANALRELGVRRGDRVGIFRYKGLMSAISVYGIMKSGAAFVPLDPASPAVRLGEILRDCSIQVLITDDRSMATLRRLHDVDATLNPVLIGVSGGDDFPFRCHKESEFSNLSKTPPVTGSRSTDIAYLMYTSGSTGEPKGIVHTHSSGLAYAEAARSTYGVVSDDRLSNFPPLHFDQSTFDYFAGPLAGATTVVIPEALTRFPASLSKLIETERLTFWYSVPFALIQLVRFGALEKRDLSSLRWVKFGGEPFPPKYLHRLQNLLPGARFSNVYGPAEVNQCTFYHVPRGIVEADDPLPIGQLWHAAEGLILDGQDVPVADGETGELLVRSSTMMQGYWNRPDLEEQAFLVQQGQDWSERYYRTGDLVRRRPDGNLDFLGRMDRQVKSRGYRVELDEVERAILEHTSIAEAAVYTIPSEGGSRLIAAAVVIREGLELSKRDVRSHLAARIPAYAVPANIVFIDAFPRTANGKINRRQLQKHTLTQSLI